MSLQSRNDRKLEKPQAPDDAGDSSVKQLLVPEKFRIPDELLIPAIWGPAPVPQSRRLIKAVNERKQ